MAGTFGRYGNANSGMWNTSEGNYNGLKNMPSKTKKYKLIDLFCGAGGMTCGFVRSQRFDPIYAVENQEDFAQTYAANFGNHVDTRPIEEAVKDATLLKKRADIVVGGPPCQGFSNLTLNRPNDHRRTLWQYFMAVVESSKCKVFLMENVPNLLRSDEGEAIQQAARDLGFHVTAKILLASNFGVPQNRRRVFIFGSKYGLPDLPDGNGARMTVREAFRGVSKKPKVYEFKPNGPVPTTALHIGRNPTAVSLQRYKLIPPGGNRFDLQAQAPEITPQCWIRKKSGGTDLFGRLEWDGPARCTIRTEFYKPEKGRYLHPSEDRPITHLEAARLQSFPDDFLWCGTKIRIGIQIGNAVPPVLAEALANHVGDYMDTNRGKRPRRAVATV